MNRHSDMEISSMLVFLSILSIVLQFGAYYIFASPIIILGIGIFAVIICTHILLEFSLNFKSCFIYTILILFISLIITLLTYLGKETPIPFSKTLIAIVSVNWFVPTIYCILRNMFDTAGRCHNFKSYFRNVSIIFILFYLVILIYASFGKEAFPWMYRFKTEGRNFTPFWTIATQIEDYINRMIPLSDIFDYLLSRILLYVPYGFYVLIILRYKPKIIRFIFLLLLPSAIELFQYFMLPARCDIDDIVFALIGGVIGALLFHLNNTVYRAVSGKDFLAKDTDYIFTKKSIYY